jgi:glycosyltransferase involved in cell wall biosynthesis
MRRHISAAIIARDEEAVLPLCLKSLKWVDEIVVVDSGSTDNTVKIAGESGARVYHKKWENYAVQKNFAISKTSGEWVLSIDADEVISDGLKREIMEMLKNGTDSNAFDMPFQNIFYNKWLKHGGLYPDRHIRLFKKNEGAYPICNIHESLSVNGKIGHFENSIIHHTKTDISSHLKAIEEYTCLEARQRINSGYKPTGYTVFIRPLYRFIKYYFFRFGFLDGIQGLTFQVSTSFYMYITEAKILEKRGFKCHLMPTLFKRAR